MKAIAFAIICAAYLVLPSEEAEKWSDGWKAVNATVLIICIFGFWINILFESNK